MYRLDASKNTFLFQGICHDYHVKPQNSIRAEVKRKAKARKTKHGRHVNVFFTDMCISMNMERIIMQSRGFPHFFYHRMFTAGSQGSKVRAVFFLRNQQKAFKPFKRTEITARVKLYITMGRRTGKRCMTNRFAPGSKMRPRPK